MLFVGFADNAKGFRCINPENKKLIIARDVKFLEDTLKSMVTIDSGDLDSVREESIKEEFSSKDTEEEENQNDSFYSMSDHEDEVHDFEETITPTITVRRSSRIPKPRNFEEYVTYSAMNCDIDDDPLTIEEAMASNDHKMWKKTMLDEMDSLAENETGSRRSPTQ